MTGRDDRWSAAAWGLVRPHLPPPPGPIVELGCGPAGGLVPALLAAGYDAVGVDPEAPEGSSYAREAFEAVPRAGFAAVVASMSLHHVDDVDVVLDHVVDAMVAGGVVVVLEWDWTKFEQAAAQWCFARLADRAPTETVGWLRRHRDLAASSGRAWDDYVREWAEGHGLHSGPVMRSALDRRFECVTQHPIPYFFSELVVEAPDEAEAMAAGGLPASAFRYVGRAPPTDGR